MTPAALLPTSQLQYHPTTVPPSIHLLLLHPIQTKDLAAAARGTAAFRFSIRSSEPTDERMNERTERPPDAFCLRPTRQVYKLRVLRATESAQSLWLVLKCNSAHNHLCKSEPLFVLLNQTTANFPLIKEIKKLFNFAHVGPNKHYVF